MDEKYIVFKRDEFFQMMGTFLPKDDTDCAPIAEGMIRAADAIKLEDAVVIRKKDTFAGPALHTYSNMIALAAKTISEVNPPQGKVLQDIADYFHEQALDSDSMETRLPD